MAQKTPYDLEREALLRLLGIGDDSSISLADLRKRTGYGADVHEASFPGPDEFNDAVIAGQIMDTGSDTRTALDGRYVGKGSIILNVLDYGADPTGTADSSAAFQAALDEANTLGGTVYAPAGEYVVSGLTMSSGVRLYGAGKGQTRLLHNANNACISAIGTSGSPYNGCEVSDLSIIGDDGTASQIGVRFQYVDNGLIARCAISHVGNNGINYHSSANGRILDNDISDCGNFGILFFNSNRMLVQGNYVHDLTTASAQHFGIQSKASQLCQIIGNRVDNIAGYGLYAFSDGTMDDYGHVFADNIVTNMVSGGTMAGIGVYVNDASDIRVVNNYVDTTSSHGINTSGVSNVQILNNRVKGAGATGIAIGGTGSTLVRVIGNTVSDCTLNGITLGGNASYCRVADNTCTNLMSSSSNLNALIGVRSTATMNTITNNDCFDLVGGPTPRGVYEEGTASLNVFIGNRAGGTSSAAISLLGTGTLSVGNVSGSSETPLNVATASGKVGFFGATPVVKPTGVAADATALRTALVSLGLIGT